MLLKSKTDAEDIAQDVFIKLWERDDIWYETMPDTLFSGYTFLFFSQSLCHLSLHSFRHVDTEQ